MSSRAVPELRWWLRYGLAVGTVGLTLVITLAAHGPANRTPLFVAAVMLTAWYAGRGPGLVALLMAALVRTYFFTPPYHTLVVDSVGGLLELTLFVLTGLLMIWFAGVQKQTQAALALSNQQVQAEIEEHRRAESELRQVGAALRQSEAHLAEAQRLSHSGSWVWDAASGELSHASDEHSRLFGAPPGTPLSFEEWRNRIHPDDRERVLATFGRAIRERRDCELEYRTVGPDGTVKHIHSVAHAVLDPSGDLRELIGTEMDLTERARAESFREGQRRILEMIAKDAPLDATLENLVRFIETSVDGALCSILLRDQDGRRLRLGAAPSLPEAYNQSVDGIPIGPEAGSCGTAMYRKEPVLVTDIARDPLWREYREVALAHNLRACWSSPIFAPSGAPVGAFAMYYRSRSVRSTCVSSRTWTGLIGRSRGPTISSAVALAQKTLRDARSAVWDLRASERVNGDFVATLRSTAEEAARCADVALDFQVTGCPRTLLPAVEAVLRRVAQEAIANVVKHAAAQSIRLTVAYGTKGVRLSVVDDGRGFVVGPHFRSYGGHWGLLGMQERATAIGAKLLVRSAPGRGTEIVLRVPYAPTRPPRRDRTRTNV